MESEKSNAPKGFARTNFYMPAKRSMLIGGLILASLFVLLLLSYSYRAIFLLFNIFSLYIFVAYLVLWFEGAYKEELPPKPKKWPSVSVIIPSFNAGHTIFDCIRACKEIDYEGAKEIIVVDDGSSDGSYEKLKSVEGIKLLHKEKNAGKAAAVNFGIKNSKGEIICCVDSDTYPEKQALSNGVRYFDQDRKVGCVAMFICVHKPKNLLARMQEIEYWVAFGFFFKANSFMDSLYVAPGPTSLYKREVFDKIGLFDEGNITEDMEMALRMQKNGWKLRTYHSAIAYTEVPTTLQSLLKQRIRWFRGGLMNLLKYNEMVFNPRYNLLGIFVMPAILISGLLSALFVFWTILVSIKQAVLYTLPVIYKPDIAFETLLHLKFPALYSIDSVFIFGIGALVLWFYFLTKGVELSKNKLGKRHVLPLILMFTLYPIFVGVAYFASYMYEFSGKEYRW